MRKKEAVTPLHPTLRVSNVKLSKNRKRKQESKQASKQRKGKVGAEREQPKPDVSKQLASLFLPRC